MKKRLLSVVYMVLITAVFSGLVTAVKELSDTAIETNRLLKFRRGVLTALDISLPGGLDTESFLRFYRRRVRELTLGETTYYQGLGEDGTSVKGYAFPVEGGGLWGRISGLAAVNAEGTRLIGLTFLNHSETPGLGGRISEPWFLKQFRGLPLTSASGTDIYFTLGRGERPDSVPGLDAVTGATITSDAVEAFLNQDIHDFLTNEWPALKEKQ